MFELVSVDGEVLLDRSIIFAPERESDAAITAIDKFPDVFSDES